MAVCLPHFAILSLLTLKLCLYVATSQRQKLHVFPPQLFIHFMAAVQSCCDSNILCMDASDVITRKDAMCFMQILRHCNFL